MVRVINVSSLGFDFGQSYSAVEGLDFSTLLEDNPTDDMLLAISKRTKRTRGCRATKQAPAYSVPKASTPEAFKFGIRLTK
jgi:hypothetical protein